MSESLLKAVQRESELKVTGTFDEEILMNCMRCGFCLSACPTYRHEEVESAAPRGRIALMRAVHEENLSIVDIAQSLDECLGCRACEVVCPAGVEYGTLLESGRAALTAARPNPWPMRFAYKYVLGTPFGIKAAGWGLWLYQVTGLQKLAQATGLVAKIGGVGMAGMEAAVPRTASPLRRAQARQLPITYAVGPRRLKVGFFLGCLSEIAFFETNQNAIAVLAQAGCEVTIVPGQGCCGAVHAHAGEHDLFVQQATRNIAAFENGGFDYIVNTAGGCGAALKEYGKHFQNDPQWAERAAQFSARCKDFAELVAELAPLPMGELSGRVTYQDSCHLRNVQKVVGQPRKLLKSIPGMEYVELPEADRCCGAAGTYAMTQALISDDLLDQKMEKVKGTRAATLVVANPPCQLEMIEGVQRAGLADQIQVKHIADVLAEAVRKAKKK
ncbi:MAG: (Fe-S)-binding protein [Mycobacterium leprae]